MIDPKLEDAVDELLKDVNALDAGNENAPIYTLDQKLSIIDRKIKIEALKLKVEDGDDGSAFRRPEPRLEKTQ